MKLPIPQGGYGVFDKGAKYRPDIVETFHWNVSSSGRWRREQEPYQKKTPY